MGAAGAGGAGGGAAAAPPPGPSQVGSYVRWTDDEVEELVTSAEEAVGARSAASPAGRLSWDLAPRRPLLKRFKRKQLADKWRALSQGARCSVGRCPAFHARLLAVLEALEA
jgi:hypothetical protein